MAPPRAAGPQDCADQPGIDLLCRDSCENGEGRLLPNPPPPPFGSGSVVKLSKKVFFTKFQNLVKKYLVIKFFLCGWVF